MRPAVLLLAVACALSGPVRAAGHALGGNVESLLAYAREHHPEIVAMRHEAEAATARIEPAGALPDPMLGVELRDFSTRSTPLDKPELSPARVGSTRYTVTQSLPWFGKRELRRDIAAADAEAAQGRTGAAWLDLAWQIKQTYAQHHLHMTNLQYARENLELLGQLERIAQARYANGLAPQQDAIRAQTERTALRGELAMLEADDAQMAARLFNLLGRPSGIQLAPPHQLRALPPAARLDAGTLEARAAERNPRVATEMARIESAEKNRALTLKNRYPDFNVGLASIQSRERVVGWDLMFEINIPLQQESRRAQEREAERMLDAARARKAAALNQSAVELAESLAALHAARRVEALIDGSLLPQAELTLQAALAGYETGKVDFAAVLDAQRQIRKAKEDRVRARVNQQLRLADIERAIGEEL